MTIHIKSSQQRCNDSKPENLTYTLEGFELRIFSSGGGCDDHYAMPPELEWQVSASRPFS
jgi:hypothetical protein